MIQAQGEPDRGRSRHEPGAPVGTTPDAPVWRSRQVSGGPVRGRLAPAPGLPSRHGLGHEAD